MMERQNVKSICMIMNAFFFSIGLYAQPFGEAAMNFRITRLDYENTSGEKAKTYFKYDKNGVLTRALWILDDGSRSSSNWYEYDSHGWLIAAYRDFSDGLTSFELFFYDSLGNKISERFYRSDSVSGSAAWQFENHCIRQAEFNNHKGWLNGTLVYLYDNQKKRESARLIKDSKTICLISFEYDEDHNLRKEYWDFDGKWSQTFIYHYQRKNFKRIYYSSPFLTNEGGYRIIKENYTFNDETGGPSFYDYNSQGLLDKKVFVRSDGLTTGTFYEYDQEGKLIASKRYYSDHDTAYFRYIYDKYDNLVLRLDNRGDTLAGFESYLYDSEGDLIRVYLKNYDGWLSGTISLSLDDYGFVSSGKFKGENGFDADISYHYNDNGLLSGIFWKFTFGKFQQYDFEYESVGSSSD